jgi:hypothetical protein
MRTATCAPPVKPLNSPLSGRTGIGNLARAVNPGRYELTWGAPQYGGLVKVFEVVEVDGPLTAWKLPG